MFGSRILSLRVQSWYDFLFENARGKFLLIRTVDHGMTVKELYEKVIERTYKPASSKEDCYCCELIIPGFDDKGQLFKGNDQLLICDTHGPKPLPPDQAGKVKALKDQAPGWRAIVLSEEYLTTEMSQYSLSVQQILSTLCTPKLFALLLLLMKRSQCDTCISKLSLSANTIKARLNALDKHCFYCRPERNLGERDASWWDEILVISRRATGSKTFPQIASTRYQRT